MENFDYFNEINHFKCVIMFMLDKNQNVNQYMLDLVNNNIDMYNKNKDMSFLLKAYLIIKIASNYEINNQYLIGEVIQNQSNTLLFDFSKNIDKIYKSKLTKNKIKSMIGKWYPPQDKSLENIRCLPEKQKKIDEVIEDIKFKVDNSLKGCYYYYTGKPNNNIIYGKYVYVLIIGNDQIFFFDIARNLVFNIIN